MKVIQKSQVKSFYDDWGIKQDNPGAYEDMALETLKSYIPWSEVNSLFEFGHGTGKFALELFETKLHPETKYRGHDLSDTMHELAKSRLAKYPTAKVTKTNGDITFAKDLNGLDLILSNFVLDILSPQEIHTFYDQAYRSLREGGFLALSSLHKGCSPLARVRNGLWSFVYKISPMKVGGCRALDLLKYADEKRWDSVCHKIHDTSGVSSEVLILKRRTLS